MTWTQSFLILAFAGLSLTFGACTSSTTPPGDVLAVNLRTGETRTFDDEASVPDGWVPCAADRTCPAPYECNALDESACIVRTDCDPLYAGTADDAPSFASCGTLECAPDACGPTPGAPAYMCEDGSLGGNTGRCIRSSDAGACTWEFRECPAECTETECGPAPGAPNFTCDDGSWGGPGPCIRNPEGTCGWSWRDCPTTECTPEECGPTPGAPAYMCEDGSLGGNTGRCIRDADGDGDATTCSWEFRTCPSITCRPSDCGDTLGPEPVCSDGTGAASVCDAVYGACAWRFECAGCAPADCGSAPAAFMCPDGSLATTLCEPSAAGTCGWQFLCPGE